MSRTNDEIEAEERQLKNRLIELDVEIKNHPENAPFTKALELQRILDGQGKRLHDLENEREAIQSKLKALAAEKTAGGPRRPGYGELKVIVAELSERDGLVIGETVSSKRIAGWIRECRELGIELHAASIRKKLSELGYTTERPMD